MKRRVISVLVALSLLLSFTAVTAKAATQVEIDQAIQDGLAYLASTQAGDGSWGSGSYRLAHTAAAVLAFENEGHFPGGGTAYSTNVENGLTYIFTLAYTQAIGVQTAGNPDTNNVNGLGVYFNYASLTYETGMVMQAIVASNTPNRVVVGGNCNGWTYRQVMEDLVDWCAFAQIDGGTGRGGWRYGAYNNQGGDGDNSVSQWPVLGLIAAEQWGISAPQFVKDELEFWVTYIQNPNGCSGYSTPDNYVNISKTGGLLVEFYYLGDDQYTARAQAAINCIDAKWANTPSGWYGNKGHPYAMFSVFKGLELMEVESIPSAPAHPPDTVAGDWWGDYCDFLVDDQNGDGSWSGYSNWTLAMATGWYIVILQATVFPVTVEIEAEEPACNTGYDVYVNYSIERFAANGTIEIYEDGNLVHTITLTDFQGSAMYTHHVGSDSVGPHTWLAVMDVDAGGGVIAHAEDIDMIVVEECGEPVEVGGDVSSVNKLLLLAPWIALTIVALAATIMVVRRLRIQS